MPHDDQSVHTIIYTNKKMGHLRLVKSSLIIIIIFSIICIIVTTYKLVNEQKISTDYHPYYFHDKLQLVSKQKEGRGNSSNNDHKDISINTARIGIGQQQSITNKTIIRESPQDVSKQIDQLNLKSLHHPHFIIIGAQKGGTTALNEYLKKHTQLQASSRKEPHFFDKMMHPTLEKKLLDNSTNDTIIKSTLVRYWKFAFPFLFNDANNDETKSQISKANATAAATTTATTTTELFSKYTYEKTPSYIICQSCPSTIKTLLPWIKLVVLLRNPIDRAYSHYKMTAASYKKEESIPTFLDCVNSDIEDLITSGIIPPNFNTQLTPEEYQDWVEKHHFNTTTTDSAGNNYRDLVWKNYTETHRLTVKGLQYSVAIKKGAKVKERKFCDQLLGRGLYALQLQRWIDIFQNHDIMSVNNSIQNSSTTEILPLKDRFLFINSDEDLKPTPEQIIDLNEVTNFLGIEPLVIQQAKQIHRTTDKFVRNETNTDEVREMLQYLYKPFNQQLYQILGDKKWKNVWQL